MSERGMRAEVAESWHRSAAAGVGVGQTGALIAVETPDLRERRSAHPLSRVFPLIDDVLGQTVRDCDALMAISDAEGTLLWVCGTPATLRRAERIGFVEGSNWDERVAGTNAPGLALATGQPATVTREEHFRDVVRPWSCAATPIHDPTTTELLGVLDVTGGDAIVVPQTMAMVRAAARLAEAELARGGAARAARAADRAGVVQVVLESLGRSESLVSVDDGRGRPETLRLSPRHSEILLLLATAPDGLTASELALGLSDHDGPGVTIRAEMARLRAALAPLTVASRPYRLSAPVHTDVDVVKDAMAHGEYRRAVAAYRGPVLPASEAPAVVELRDDLHGRLRAGLLRSSDPDALLCFADTDHGRDDVAIWATALGALPVDSPRRPQVQNHLDRLVAELA